MSVKLNYIKYIVYLMAERISEMTPTEKDLVRLNSYLSEIWTDLLGLELGLRINKSLTNFPQYKELGEVAGLCGNYIREFDEYCKDIRSLVAAKGWLKSTHRFLEDKVYKLALEIDKYRLRRFRRHWKDGITKELEETEDLVYDIQESKNILDRLYKMHDVEPELLTKLEKTKPQLAVVKFVMLILILSLGFVSLRIVGGMQTAGFIGLPTGFSPLPTAEIAGVNFEMFYVITATMIVSIYILGKLMKKW